nr:two-component response regulator ARR22 [Ipomoea batatas]
MLLTKYGREAQMAKKGEEAVVLHRFDLLLMDKDMPIKGRQCNSRAAGDGVKSMIVGVTSQEPGAVMDEFIAAGLDECLTKPLGQEVAGYGHGFEECWEGTEGACSRPPVKDGVNETREVGAKSMIISVTSHEPGAVMDEFIVVGLDECLTKPLGPKVFLRLINQLVA